MIYSTVDYPPLKYCSQAQFAGAHCYPIFQWRYANVLTSLCPFLCLAETNYNNSVGLLSKFDCLTKIVLLLREQLLQSQYYKTFTNSCICFIALDTIANYSQGHSDNYESCNMLWHILCHIFFLWYLRFKSVQVHSIAQFNKKGDWTFKSIPTKLALIECTR